MTDAASMLDAGSLVCAVAGHEFWEAYLITAMESTAVRIHLGVFVEPYLTFVLDGTKTIESRFSKNAIAPFNRISAGDIVLLKRSGGGIEGISRVADAWFYELQPDSWGEIRRRFSGAMRVTPQFLEDKRAASFATLVLMDSVYGFRPLPTSKRDRRGWVIVHEPEAMREGRKPQLSLSI